MMVVETHPAGVTMHRPGGAAALPITFLVDDAFGGGGVARTVANLANHLARRHPVRVISFRRKRRATRFPLDRSVRVTVVRDQRRGRTAGNALTRALDRRPSRLRPRPSTTTMSLLSDLQLRHAIRSVRSGVLVSCRPSLHLAAVTFARWEVKTVGWDHLNFPARLGKAGQFEVLSAALPRLDAYVVLTEEDAADYRQSSPGARTDIRVIRNSLSWPVAAEQAAHDSKVIVAGGQLIRRKGFDRLVRAFAPVAATHPDWQLHIYGRGRHRRIIRPLIDRLGLGSRVRLQGFTADFASVLTSASVFAMSSRSEGFPMALLEAMSVGLPIVVSDCPRGPREIIRDGHNGLLVPAGDTTAFGSALRRLIEDPALRQRLGAQARIDAEQYTLDAVAADWERLFDRLYRRPDGRTAPKRPRLAFGTCSPRCWWPTVARSPSGRSAPPTSWARRPLRSSPTRTGAPSTG
jgi:glycosyltransferase involved in cell wall biosynthesis